MSAYTGIDLIWVSTYVWTLMGENIASRVSVNFVSFRPESLSGKVALEV